MLIGKLRTIPPQNTPPLYPEMPNNSDAALLLIQQRISHILCNDIELGRVHNPANYQAIYDQRRYIILQTPNFWLTALLSHPALSLIVTSEDAMLLRQLTDLDVRLSDTNTADFDIVLTFSTNPYFSNETISKHYTCTDHHGRVVANMDVSWSDSHKSSKSGFFAWLCNDTRDSSHLGELIRQQIFTHAIELYFGTYKIETDPTRPLNTINRPQ